MIRNGAAALYPASPPTPLFLHLPVSKHSIPSCTRLKSCCPPKTETFHKPYRKTNVSWLTPSWPGIDGGRTTLSGFGATRAPEQLSFFVVLASKNSCSSMRTLVRAYSDRWQVSSKESGCDCVVFSFRRGLQVRSRVFPGSRPGPSLQQYFLTLPFPLVFRLLCPYAPWPAPAAASST